MDILNLIISLISGGLGGNAAGMAMPEKNLGAIANTIMGLIGGGAGDFILKALGILGSTAATTGAAATTGSGEFDIAALLANIGVSGVSGGALTAIITLIKNMLDKK